MAVMGIGGHPFIDLEPYVDLPALQGLDDEITYALTQVPIDYTGGSHKTMGIVPPSLADEPYVDYGHVIQRFSAREFSTFISLSDTPERFDVRRRHEYEFGEEREWPLSRKQMLYLKFKYGVYFPWQVFYELIPTLNWEDKSSGAGKDFTDEAKVQFPRLVAFVKALPFEVVGRCNILGLEANHHGTVHQDGDPDDPRAEHFITLCPRRNKRLFLWDEETKSKKFVISRAYWFNDHGYHGVEADPYFRYSVRVDGVFQPSFLERLRRDWRIGAEAAGGDCYAVGAMKRRTNRRRQSAQSVICPFCGEEENLSVDPGGGDRQTYTEDCAVCCRPRVVHVEPTDEPGEVRVWLERGE